MDHHTLNGTETLPLDGIHILEEAFDWDNGHLILVCACVRIAQMLVRVVYS